MAGPTTQQLSERMEKYERSLRDLDLTVQRLDERMNNAREDIKRLATPSTG